MHTADNALAGGLVGMMLGIFAGPLGVLLGGSFGSLVGLDVDTVDTVYEVSMLDQIADKLDEGMVAIIALADESSEEELAERRAEKEKERIAAEKEFEENSEILRQGFTK